MSNTDTVLNRLNEAIQIFEDGIEVVLEGAEGVKAAPRIAGEAKTLATSAQTQAAEAKTLAQNALPKTGGTMTGALHLSPVTYQKQPSADVSLTENRASRAYNQIFFQDANSFNYGELGVYQEINLGIAAKLQATNKKADGTSVSASILAYALKDGTTYAACPPPRADNYGNDIVNTKAMVDYAPKILPANMRTLYVNAITGSDTADLHNGRGFRPELPFKSLEAILAYMDRLSTPYLNILLCSDCTVTNPQYVRLFNTPTLYISSAGTEQRTINCKGFNVLNGFVNFADVKLNAMDGTETLLTSQYGGVISITGSVEMSGAASLATVHASRGGIFSLASSATLTGTITAKRYIANTGGKIFVADKGPDAIPGTIAGICDSSSVYA